MGLDPERLHREKKKRKTLAPRVSVRLSLSLLKPAAAAAGRFGPAITYFGMLAGDDWRARGPTSLNRQSLPTLCVGVFYTPL